METHRHHGAGVDGLFLLDLPIRDGNPGGCAGAVRGHVLLDLPIRDGNSRTSHINASVTATFRPSYQGWKPMIW